MNKSERKTVHVNYMHRMDKSQLIPAECLIDSSVLRPKNLVENPLRVHEPLALEMKIKEVSAVVYGF